MKGQTDMDEREPLEDVTTFGTVTPSNNETIEEGVYTVKFVGAKRAEGDFGKYYIFKFEVQDEDLLNWPLTGTCNAVENPSELTKVYAWYTALLGRKLEEGETMDLEAIIGKRVNAQVELKTKEDGTARNKVAALIPIRKRAPQAPAPVASGNKQRQAAPQRSRASEPPDMEEPPESVYADDSPF